MIIKYTTKKDQNGKRKTLWINPENKTFLILGNVQKTYTEYTIISKQDIKNQIILLLNNGYKLEQG